MGIYWAIPLPRQAYSALTFRLCQRVVACKPLQIWIGSLLEAGLERGTDCIFTREELCLAVRCMWMTTPGKHEVRNSFLNSKGPHWWTSWCTFDSVQPELSAGHPSSFLEGEHCSTTNSETWERSNYPNLALPYHAAVLSWLFIGTSCCCFLGVCGWQYVSSLPKPVWFLM
jgi:hypothetical protein